MSDCDDFATVLAAAQAEAEERADAGSLTDSELTDILREHDLAVLVTSMESLGKGSLIRGKLYWQAREVTKLRVQTESDPPASCARGWLLAMVLGYETDDATTTETPPMQDANATTGDA